GAAEERELRIARRGIERCSLEQHEKSEQRRQRKCRGQKTEDAVRMRGANELIDQIKVQRSGERRCRPRRCFSREAPMKNERKHTEHDTKYEIPNQLQRSARRIEMLKMPRVFQRHH